MFRSGRKNNLYLRSQKGASEIAEFLPALYIIFVLAFFPLLNLAFLFSAAAIQYLATNDCAAKAATQNSFDATLNTMANEAFSLQNFGLAKFVGLAPQSGYTGCGDDLYILSTNVASGMVTESSANVPLTQNVDTGSNVYEISVRSNYNVSPLVNFSAIPVLGEIPGMGKPVNLTFTANRPIEHPGGFQMSSSNNTSNGDNTPITAFNRTNDPGNDPTATNATWNNPTIFQQIRAAGESVVSVNVFTVKANNPNWTIAQLQVLPGQKVWIDSQAQGAWSWGVVTSWPLFDANGLSSTDSSNIAPTLPSGSLIARFGTSTPFKVGDELLNYQPSTSGPLSMIMNDGPADFSDNVGEQMVRVVIAQ